MNYSYEIERLSAIQNFMRVRYFAPNQPDYRKAFTPNQFDRAFLENLIESYFPVVKAEWDRIASVTEPDPTEVGVGEVRSKVYVPVTPPERTPEERRDEARVRLEQEVNSLGSGNIDWDRGDGVTWRIKLDKKTEDRLQIAVQNMANGTSPRPTVTTITAYQQAEPGRPFQINLTDAEVKEVLGLIDYYYEDLAAAYQAAIDKLFDTNNYNSSVIEELATIRTP